MRRRLPSKVAILWAFALCVLHVLMAIYVVLENVLYDERGIIGISWWLVNFWVFPIIAVLLLLISWLMNRQ